MKSALVLPRKRRSVQAIRLRPKLSRVTSGNYWFKNHLILIKNRFIIGLLLNLVGSFWLWLLEPHTWPINTVRIEGNLRKTDQQKLQITLSKIARGNFWSINLQTIRLAVLKYPWVKDVQVRRQWPDTLLMQIQERQVLAQRLMFNEPLENALASRLPTVS